MRKSKDEKRINLQCKKGYLLDDMDRYDVYRPLCEINGYDEDTCPTDGILSWSGIMSWSACQMFGYVCKFCLVCSNEIYKASNSIYICFIKGAGILGLQLILLIWAAGCNCSNIVKVIMSAEAVLEIFSIVALIVLFQIWYDDIVSAKHLLGWMIFIAYMDLTFHLGRLEV